MRHVLIIEDHPVLAEILADMAMVAGASSTDIAFSEEMALECARRHAPRLIFSDVDLCEGGRGPRAVATIQQNFGAIPTVFVTGTPNDAEALALAVLLLLKPFTEEQIVAAFTYVLQNCPDPRSPSMFH